jgi:hypothetical protein
MDVSVDAFDRYEPLGNNQLEIGSRRLTLPGNDRAKAHLARA